MGATIKMIDGSEILILESIEQLERFVTDYVWVKVTEQIGINQAGIIETRMCIVNVNNIIKIY